MTIQWNSILDWALLGEAAAAIAVPWGISILAGYAQAALRGGTKR